MAEEEKLVQGESYEEDAVSNDVEPKSKKNVKMMAIGAIAIFAVGVVIMAMAKKQNTEPVVVEEEDSYVDEYWDDEIEFQEDTVYEDEEVMELRALGYTGDEITYYKNNNVSFDVMVDMAKELQAEKQEEVIAEVNDKATGAYKKLLDMTWMGGKKIKVQEPPDAFEIEYNTYIENVDYVKCGQQGRQLFIRCTLDDGTHAFMCVSPDRWYNMKKKGNIVIEYTVMNYKETSVITDVQEVDTSMPEDE